MDTNQTQAAAKAVLVHTQDRCDLGQIDKSNPTDALLMICVSQQQQIEMLTRIIGKIAPQLYAAEKLMPIRRNTSPSPFDEEFDD